MRFVRKPKPYTRGRGAARFPSQARGGRFSFQGPSLQWPQPSRPITNPLARQTATRRRPTQVGAAFEALPQPGGRWLGALATLGAAMCLLMGGSILLNAAAREAQFQSIATHLDALKPAAEAQ